jgi:L-rhamnose mutarotase
LAEGAIYPLESTPGMQGWHALWLGGDTLRRNCKQTIAKGLMRDGGEMPRHCLTLDLKDDEEAIAEYKRYHMKIWPEVRDSLFASGVLHMEIYLLGTRMFMIMDVNDTFFLPAKAAADAVNAKVQEWETIMHGFQQQLPEAKPNQWWMAMDRVFNLADQ